MSLRNKQWMRNALLPALFRLLLASVVIALSPTLLNVDSAQAPLIASVYSCAAIVALMFFAPLEHASLQKLILWCAALAVITILIIVVHTTTRSIAFSTPKLALAIFILAATFGIMAQRIAPTILIGGFVIVALTPVWAGSVLELVNNPTWANRLVINISPLSLFANALDFDYLRTDWFYEHSAVAAMRYSYPNFWYSIGVIAILPAAAILKEYVKNHSINHQSLEACS